MKKLARLIQESFYALGAYRNPFTYFGVRCGFFGNKKVVIQMRNGAAYSIHADTNEVRMINEIWNVAVYDKLLDRIHDGSTVVDIGANIGIFTIKAARAAKNVKVFSYEPFPESFESLTKNIHLNGLETTVKATNAAVAGKHGELTLFFRAHDPGGVSLHEYGDKSELSSLKVPSFTLEEVFRANKIEVCDYLKMDCEGAEEQIVMQTPKELFERIKSITLEWHGPLNTMSVGEFMAYLESLGYKTEYDPATLSLYAWR